MSISIQEASGRAECKFCNEIIGKGELEVRGNLGSGNYSYSYHLKLTHIDRMKTCEGFILRKWKFIEDLISQLSDSQLATLGLVHGNL